MSMRPTTTASTPISIIFSRRGVGDCCKTSWEWTVPTILQVLGKFSICISKNRQVRKVQVLDAVKQCIIGCRAVRPFSLRPALQCLAKYEDHGGADPLGTKLPLTERFTDYHRIRLTMVGFRCKGGNQVPVCAVVSTPSKPASMAFFAAVT